MRPTVFARTGRFDLPSACSREQLRSVTDSQQRVLTVNSAQVGLERFGTIHRIGTYVYYYDADTESEATDMDNEPEIEEEYAAEADTEDGPVMRRSSPAATARCMNTVSSERSVHTP